MSNYQTRNRFFSKMVGFFLILTILAIFVIFHFASAKATIKIYGQIQEQDYKTLIEMLPENSQALATNQILGKILTQELETEISVDSEMTTSTATKAGGFVKLINQSSKDQTLIATTRLLSLDNKLYRLTEKVIVPKNSEIRAWAEADQEGENFVAPAGKMMIPGLFPAVQEKIYGQSEGFSMNGTPSYQVTENSLKNATEKLQAEVKAKFLEDINKTLADDLKINADHIFAKFETVTSSALGEKTAQTTIKQKANLTALIFSPTDLKKASHAKYQAELSSNSKLLEILPDFSYKITEVDLSTNQAIIETSFKAKVSVKQDILEINKDKLIGLTESEVNDYLSQFQVDKSEVEFFPFWVKKVPKFKDHIIIE